MAARAGEITVHATCVAVAGRGALIRGAPGAGKSALALQLLAYGAALVADDRTRLWRDGGMVMADAPGTIAGQIEARGMGILHAPPAGPTPIALIVEMDAPAPPRLPPEDHEDVLGLRIARTGKSGAGHFSAALYLYLMHGRVA